MSETLLPSYPVNQNDRLGLTIFLAVCLHAIIILGVSFTFSDSSPDISSDLLEITIVDTRSIEAPEEADVYAQTQQVGGGDSDEYERPSSPLSNPIPDNSDGIAPYSDPHTAPPELDKTEAQTEILTVNESDVFLPSKEFAEDIPFETESKDSATIIERSRNYARVSAHIDQVNRSMQRHTHVNGVNAKEYHLASYINSWQTKLFEYERLHESDYVKKHKLNVSVILDVAIRVDGNIDSVTIKRSSGHPEIDRYAKKMAIGASPYAPLPQEIRKTTDVLHIELQWNFKYSDGKSYITYK